MLTFGPNVGWYVGPGRYEGGGARFATFSADVGDGREALPTNPAGGFGIVP